jgi:4-hydroxyacetophenone monooxygenase
MGSDISAAAVDEAFLERSLALADLDALKVSLFHLTGEERIAALPLAAQMTDDDKQMLRERVAAWLRKNAGSQSLPEPPAPRLRRMMEMLVGHPIGDAEFAARRDVPGFRDYPFMADWEGEAPLIPGGFKVAIVGCGFAGIGMAVQLDRVGIPYEVLERRGEPGGVWSVNRYPDVRVDTASITYEFPFEKDFAWSEYFGRGSEVQAYLTHVSKKRGVWEKTRFDHDVRSARFDEARDLWVLDVTTPAGDKVVEANAVVSAAGLFTTPFLPTYEGQDNFKGTIVHPARWPADLDLRGKRVATIGNGSTGVQMLGSIAEQAEQVFVFQRTPQWIMAKEKYGQPIEPEIHWLLANLPGYSNWHRFSMTAPLFETHPLVTVDRAWQAQGGLVNRQSDALRAQMTDYIRSETSGRQDLIDKLIPDYAPFSRRPVMDNGWYRALTRDNVELVTGPVARLEPTGIVGQDGVLRDVDVIVSATGFDIVRYLWPMRYTGVGGVDLHDRWHAGDGPRAYLGLLVPDFPNFFTIYGPNSQPVSGGPSIPAWFALWSGFIAQCLMRMLETGTTRLEVTHAAFDDYNRRLDIEAASLVHMSPEGGFDRNYYVNQDHSRLQVNAPWYAPDFHRLFSDIRWEDLAFSSSGSRVRSAA